MAKNKQAARSGNRLLPVVPVDMHQEAGATYCCEDSMRSQGGRRTIAGARTAVYAPFIAQLAGQIETAEVARLRRRESREAANRNYERMRARAFQVYPTVTLIV